jgi:hypothetical protein
MRGIGTDNSGFITYNVSLPVSESSGVESASSSDSTSEPEARTYGISALVSDPYRQYLRRIHLDTSLAIRGRRTRLDDMIDLIGPLSISLPTESGSPIPRLSGKLQKTNQDVGVLARWFDQQPRPESEPPSASEIHEFLSQSAPKQIQSIKHDKGYEEAVLAQLRNFCDITYA